MGGRRTVEEKKRGPWRPERTDRFARLAHQLLDRPSYRSLSPNARALLVEFAMMYNAKNNGALWLSVRDAADRMGVSDLKAASAGLRELETAGFIAMVADAHFAVKAGEGSRARCWRITWEGVVGRTFQPATNEYQEREPEPGTRDRRRMDRGLRALKRWRREVQGGEKSPVEDSTTRPLKRVEDCRTTAPGKVTPAPVSVEDSTTRNEGNGGKPRNLVVEDSTTHIAIPASTAKKGKDRGADNPDDPSAFDAIRVLIAQRCSSMNGAARTALARRVGISSADLSSFVEGRLTLPIGKQMALRTEARAAA